MDISGGGTEKYVHVPQDCVTKKELFLGLYNIYICVFFNPLRIFVPCVDILFFIKNYFLVYIFKYRTRLCKFH